MRPLLLALAVTLAALLPAAPPAWAVNPDEILEDPLLEARARELSKGIRCLVCQNESIDSSNADLARDLRVLVRERLTAGDSDRQVLDFLVDRYGDFVLLEPPVRPTTYLLWFGPAVLLLIGAIGVLAFYRGRQRSVAAAAPLSEGERKRLEQLLAADGTDESDTRR